MVTQPEKEQQILDYIHDTSRRGEWSKLTKDSLISKFQDKKFPKNMIKKMIDAMEEANEIKTKRLEYDFYCWPNMEYEIDKKLGKKTIHGKSNSYILSFLIYIFLLNIPAVFSWYTDILKNKEEALKAFDLLVYGFVFSFVFIWGLSKAIQAIWSWYKRNEQKIWNYKWMIYLYLATLLIAIAAYWLFGGEIAAYIASVIGIGTALNALIYQIIKSKSKVIQNV